MRRCAGVSVEPTLLTFTVMKNEGPFIIEWVAWQRLMGVDNILVLSNDCDDGTDDMLNQLDRMGVVRHLPNPSQLAPAASALRRQPHMTGIAYAHRLREWRDADYIFLTDVDEFPVPHGETGTLKNLLARLDYPDALTMSETVFGTSGIVEFDDSPVTAQFSLSSSTRPGKWRSRRGFKSITRNDPRLVIRNHRPIAKKDVAGELRWLDGSGRDFPVELRHVHQKGWDARGTFDLVALHHYALRSVESFLVKAARGDAVVPDRIDRSYFKTRNQRFERNTSMLTHQPALAAEIDRLKGDARLADLHDRAVSAHRAKIDKLKATPLFGELLEMVEGTPAPAADG